MSRGMQMVYDLYDTESGEFAGKYEAKEIAEMLHIGIQTVYSAANSKRTCLGRWKIEPGIPPDFKKTWSRDCAAVKARLIFEGRYHREE